MSVPNGGETARITLREVFDRVLQVGEGVARLEGKVDALHSERQQLQKVASDFEARLRSLEKWKYAIPVSVLVALAALGGSLIRKV